MEFKINALQIDNKDVDKILWIKYNGRQISKNDILNEPLYLSIDNYSENSTGETAIITVKTDNNVYKDILLKRCKYEHSSDTYTISILSGNVNCNGGEITLISS